MNVGVMSFYIFIYPFIYIHILRLRDGERGEVAHIEKEKEKGGGNDVRIYE